MQTPKDLLELFLDPVVIFLGVWYLAFKLYRKLVPADFAQPVPPHPVSEPQGFIGLPLLAGAMLAYQVTAMTIIFVHRYDLALDIPGASIVGNVISLLVPAVALIPPLMEKDGFHDRIAVTQHVAVAGYLLAIFCALWCVRNRAALRQRIGRRFATVSRWARYGVVVFGVAFMLVIWLYLGVSAKWQRRMPFQDFETSDVQLFYHMWSVPTFAYVFGAVAIVVFAFPREVPQTKDHPPD